MVTIKEMIWVATKNMDASRADRREYHKFQLSGELYIHLLTFHGPQAKNLLHDTHILIFSQSQMSILEYH